MLHARTKSVRSTRQTGVLLNAHSRRRSRDASGRARFCVPLVRTLAPLFLCKSLAFSDLQAHHAAFAADPKVKRSVFLYVLCGADQLAFAVKLDLLSRPHKRQGDDLVAW